MFKIIIFLIFTPFLFSFAVFDANQRRVAESNFSPDSLPTATPPKNNLPVIEKVELDKTSLKLSCPPGGRSPSSCPTDLIINVLTKAADADGDALVYQYAVTGGQILGQGAEVKWDLSGVPPGTYKIKVTVADSGIPVESDSLNVTVQNCFDCIADCFCPTVSVSGSDFVTRKDKIIIFTATLNGSGEESTTYKWTVDKGKIIEGQGTPSITVNIEGLSITTVSAEVEIGDLCPDCPRLTASDTVSIP